MKCNYTKNENDKAAPMNRDARRAMYERLKPTIKRIVELEKQIKTGVNKEAAENEMAQIIEGCTMIEMFAVEDYIYNKNLLENK